MSRAQKKKGTVSGFEDSYNYHKDTFLRQRQAFRSVWQFTGRREWLILFGKGGRANGLLMGRQARWRGCAPVQQRRARTQTGYMETRMTKKAAQMTPLCSARETARKAITHCYKPWEKFLFSFNWGKTITLEAESSGSIGTRSAFCYPCDPGLVAVHLGGQAVCKAMPPLR